MSMRERFEQTAMRSVGARLSRRVLDNANAYAAKTEGGASYTVREDIRDALARTNPDNYEKISMLTYLIDANLGRNGTNKHLDSLIEELLFNLK